MADVGLVSSFRLEGACANADGYDHYVDHPADLVATTVSGCCQWPMLWCYTCRGWVTCCDCGETHSFDYCVLR